MTEQEWLSSTDPRPMLEFLRGRAEDRKVRLFAVACCRRMWLLIVDERSRDAVEVAERYADGLATEGERAAASMAAVNAIESNHGLAFAASRAVLRDRLLSNWIERAAEAARAGDTCKEAQVDLLRCIFGNPFRSITIEASHSEAVVKMAQAIYDERAFDRMPVLADALEESGVADADLLAHCRAETPHARGCHVLDLILGKK